MNAITVSILSLSMIFLATTLGSSFVFFFRRSLSDKMNNVILGFASGIMIAASFFGLILPSIEESKAYYPNFSFVAPIVGFVLGGILLFALDKIVPHIHQNSGVEEGTKTAWNKNLKFFLAVTMHNIPEGLAVGFACGLALKAGENQANLILSALSLAIGIAIQNIPEGAAVSIPMFSNGMSKTKSFLFGSASGVVEPLFGTIGLFLAQLSFVSPWLLALAAGAMIYVTLDELLPDARKGGHEHYGLMAFMVGFVIMMALEIVL